MPSEVLRQSRQRSQKYWTRSFLKTQREPCKLQAHFLHVSWGRGKMGKIRERRAPICDGEQKEQPEFIILMESPSAVDIRQVIPPTNT